MPKSPVEKPPETFEEESVTGTLCLACAGQGKIVEETATGYKSRACGYCTNGAMSPRQYVAWKERVKK